MAKVIFVCDGCARQEEGFFNRMGDAVKPESWFSRTDDGGTQIACCRQCVEVVAEKSEKTSIVAPF